MKFCYDEAQYETLQLIISNQNRLVEFHQKCYNIVDFLEIYDSINLSFIEFYRLMPKILPRFYTVASSQNYHKNKLDIIISLIDWKSAKGETRYGLTSNYYKNIQENFHLSQNCSVSTKIIVRESNFRLPNHSDYPLLMICTGTGIAPYISFLQEFAYRITEQNERETNPCYLIYGSKNQKYDFIFEKDVRTYLDKKILTNLYTAFSRDFEKKFYVQHALQEYQHELTDLIFNKHFSIYICGGVGMGGQVMQTLEQLYSKDFVKTLEKENRIIKELWG